MKDEYRVGAAVIACLLTVEAGLNWLEPSLSGDVAHILEIGDVSRRLAESSAPVKLLWLGNSLTGEGIDLPLADSILGQELGTELAGFTVHPDASSIAEWHHIANNEFFERGAAPDLLIVPFAWNLLSDQNPVNVTRVGRWYLTRSEHWIDFLRHDARGFEQSVTAVLSNVSAAYGNRDRIRDRILVELPGYETLAFALGNPRAGSPRSTEGESGGLTYTRLGRLASAARAHDVRLVIVAMPVVGSYDLDPDLVQTAERSGVVLVDARNTDGIHSGWFRDGMHLLPDGAKQVTRGIALEVGRSWSGSRRSGALEDSTSFAASR